MRLMNGLRRAARFVWMHAGLGHLKRETDLCLDRPAELVERVFEYSRGSIRPLQIAEELASLAAQVRQLRPRTVLEIGTANGGTLFLWTRLADAGATIVSIDLPGGKFGGGYPSERGIVYRRFTRSTQKLHLLRENSHDPRTRAKAVRLFGGEPIDLLFIDGDHTYEGVKQDWEQYSPLVRPGGMVVFHDIAGNYDDTQVKELWDSIKCGCRYEEYVVDSNGYYGLGILFM